MKVAKDLNISRDATDKPDIQPEKVCIVGTSGKLEQYKVQHSDRGYEVVRVCREGSVKR